MVALDFGDVNSMMNSWHDVHRLATLPRTVGNIVFGGLVVADTVAVGIVVVAVYCSNAARRAANSHADGNVVDVEQAIEPNMM